MDELVANVEQEFIRYDHWLLSKVYLTLQGCLTEVMKQHGGNGYKIPHMNKDGLEASGNLPTTLTCPLHVYHDALAKIAEF